MHTILGANGVVGRELSAVLHSEGVAVRQVSRSPKRVNASDELTVADLTDPSSAEQAVRGSAVAYLVAGLKYETRVWQDEWPRVMRNVIDACARHGCKLVFLDNVYAYGLVHGAMTEDTPFNPISRKGEVRAAIAGMLLDEVRVGNLEAMIVRSADFYGPQATQSFTHATVFGRLRAGKVAQWIGSPEAIHTFTYTPDIGRALAVLGRSNEAYGTTWHAPTSREPMTGSQFVRLACEVAGRPYRLQVAPSWILRVMSLWMPVLRENREMMYQFEQDYRFASEKIVQAYGLEATPYREGIRASWEA